MQWKVRGRYRWFIINEHPQFRRYRVFLGSPPGIPTIWARFFQPPSILAENRYRIMDAFPRPRPRTPGSMLAGLPPMPPRSINIAPGVGGERFWMYFQWYVGRPGDNVLFGGVGKNGPIWWGPQGGTRKWSDFVQIAGTLIVTSDRRPLPVRAPLSKTKHTQFSMAIPRSLGDAPLR